jgi:hypothetical protein
VDDATNEDSTLSNGETIEENDAIDRNDPFLPPPTITAQAIKIAHSLVKTSLTQLCKWTIKIKCVVPENIHTPPTESFLSLNPPPTPGNSGLQ